MQARVFSRWRRWCCWLDVIMDPLRTPRMNKKGAVFLIGLVSILGCSSWRPSPHTATREAVVDARYNRFRLTLATGEQIILREPELQGDSIVGATAVQGSRARAALPLSAVVGVEVRTLSEARTGLALIASVGVLVVFVAALVSDISEDVGLMR